MLVDDHEVVRRGVREMLEATGQIKIVGEAGTVKDAVRLAGSLQPEVIVMDVRLVDGGRARHRRQNLRPEWRRCPGWLLYET